MSADFIQTDRTQPLSGHFAALRCQAAKSLRGIRLIVGLAIAGVFLAGCASLPEYPSGVTNFAVPKDPNSSIGKMAGAALGADPRSGLRLLPIAASSYQTRIELVNQAQHTLDLQYYLFQGDDTGMYLMRALRSAAERGVRVRLLIDDLYTAGEDPLLTALNAFPNIEIRLFNPFANGRGASWSRFATSLDQLGRVNHRMHNKLFIADNEAAVTGGRNIADEYFMRSTTSNFVDLDVFTVGPVVQDLSALFDYYWNSEFAYPLADVVPPDSSAAALQRHFDELTIYAVAPPEEPQPPEFALYNSLPEELHQGSIKTLIHANAQAIADPLAKAGGANLNSISGTVTARVIDLIGTAKKDVIVATPYFVPGNKGLQDFKEEVARGVDVTVVTNSLASTDEPLVQIGYLHYRKKLLEAGVHIHELSPSLVSERNKLGDFHGSLGALHAKIALVDTERVFLGSMNLDERSAFENTELGLIIDSPELAREIISRMDRDSSYDLRLSPAGKVQWVAEEDGRQVIFDSEPEASFWSQLEVQLLDPFVPEKEL